MRHLPPRRRLLRHLNWLLVALVLLSPVLARADFLSPGERGRPGGIAQKNNVEAFWKAQRTWVDPVVDGTTVTIDLSQGNFYVWTIGATGRTLANPANPPWGGQSQSFMLKIIEGGTGSNTITTYGSAWKFSGGTKPTLSTAAGAYDIWSCVAVGLSEIDCQQVANFQ